MNSDILIVDDDSGVLSALKLLLKSEDLFSTVADSPKVALAALSRKRFDLILMDLNYSLDTTSGAEGLELIEQIRKNDEFVPIVVMTGWGTIEVAVNSMQHGANDFIQKPWDNGRLLSIINNQMKLSASQNQARKLSQHNKILEAEIDNANDTKIVARSEKMKSTLDLIEQVAKSDVNVLLTGENGTGKSLFARYIHQHSARAKQPQISVNMGAVTESLFESEMFGHMKGAFTDAKSTRIGRFELADGGTLFLDEIANTPFTQQAKLLRVLEDNQFEKVGSGKTQNVDIRLITATNGNLQQLCQDGTFRKDLLYRVNTIEIEIPPLRERKEDIISLAESFLSYFSNKYQRPLLTISYQARQQLLDYQWPGNVRELNHVIERAQILCKGETVEPFDLGLPENRATSSAEDFSGQVAANSDKALDTLEEIEITALKKRLEYFDGNASETSKSLGLSRSAFYRRMEKIQ